MNGDVIITITLNAALHVSYQAVGTVEPDTAVVPVGRPRFRAGGRGVTVARVLSAFGHDVLAAGLAGGTAGELIREDLARYGVPTAFTQIRAESRRIFQFEPGAHQFGEPGPYITTEELGRFAGDYRKLLASAAAVVLCGSLPEGLPPDMYATLVRYAAEASVPVILDAGGEELLLAIRNRPALVVAESRDPEAGQHLLRMGAAAAAVISGGTVQVVTAAGEWTAALPPQEPSPHVGEVSLDRGALVAGLVPGELLGWSWPDRLRHSLALASGRDGDVDPRAYEGLLDNVTVSPA
jgi:fructose-1-phosphate kinase PfkB-like protein